MKRVFLLLPILLLSGCAHSLYATKLNLPTLEGPAVLAPVTSATSSSMAPMISPIENALTPSQADLAVSQLRQGNALAVLFGNTSGPNDSPDLKQKKRIVSKSSIGSWLIWNRPGRSRGRNSKMEMPKMGAGKSRNALIMLVKVRPTLLL